MNSTSMMYDGTVTEDSSDGDVDGNTDHTLLPRSSSWKKHHKQTNSKSRQSCEGLYSSTGGLRTLSSTIDYIHSQQHDVNGSNLDPCVDDDDLSPHTNPTSHMSPPVLRSRAMSTDDISGLCIGEELSVPLQEYLATRRHSWCHSKGVEQALKEKKFRKRKNSHSRSRSLTAGLKQKGASRSETHVKSSCDSDTDDVDTFIQKYPSTSCLADKRTHTLTDPVQEDSRSSLELSHHSSKSVSDIYYSAHETLSNESCDGKRVSKSISMDNMLFRDDPGSPVNAYRSEQLTSSGDSLDEKVTPTTLSPTPVREDTNTTTSHRHESTSFDQTPNDDEDEVDSSSVVSNIEDDEIPVTMIDSLMGDSHDFEFDDVVHDHRKRAGSVDISSGVPDLITTNRNRCMSVRHSSDRDEISKLRNNNSSNLIKTKSMGSLIDKDQIDFTTITEEPLISACRSNNSYVNDSHQLNKHPSEEEDSDELKENKRLSLEDVPEIIEQGAISDQQKASPLLDIKPESDKKSGSVARKFSFLKMGSDRKRKDKYKDKAKNSHMFISVSYSHNNVKACDYCGKSLINKHALECQTCLMCIHDSSSCRDNIGMCKQTSNRRQSRHLKQAPVLREKAKHTAQQTASLPRDRAERPKTMFASNVGFMTKSQSSISPTGVQRIPSSPDSVSNVISEEVEYTDQSVRASTRHQSTNLPSDLKTDIQRAQSTPNINEIQSTSTESLDEVCNDTEEDTDKQLILRGMEPESWSASVDKKFLKSLTTKEVKRQDIIYELIQTEKHHMRTLKIMQRVFYDPMVETLDLPVEDIDTMFPSLPTLIDVCKEFCGNLTLRQEQSKIVDRIGDVLIKQFSGVSVESMEKGFGDFCSHHIEAVNKYKELLKNDKFGQFIRECNQHHLCRRLSIPDCITLVTQRISKYPVLLEAILKTMKDSKHPDYTDMSRALELCKQFAHNVDKYVNDYQLASRFQEICSQFDSKSFFTYKNDKSPKNWTEFQDRTLIHDGLLMWKTARGKFIEVLTILLTDYLIFAQETGNQKLSFLQQDGKCPVIHLSKLLAKEVATEKRGLYLIDRGGAEMYEIQTTGSKTRKKWLQFISDAVEKCPAEQEKPSPNIQHSNKKDHHHPSQGDMSPDSDTPPPLPDSPPPELPALSVRVSSSSDTPPSELRRGQQAGEGGGSGTGHGHRQNPGEYWPLVMELINKNNIIKSLMKEETEIRNQIKNVLEEMNEETVSSRHHIKSPDSYESGYEDSDSNKIDCIQSVINENQVLASVLAEKYDTLQRSSSSVGEKVSSHYHNVVLPKRADTLTEFDHRSEEHDTETGPCRYSDLRTLESTVEEDDIFSEGTGEDGVSDPHDGGENCAHVRPVCLQQGLSDGATESNKRISQTHQRVVSFSDQKDQSDRQQTANTIVKEFEILDELERARTKMNENHKKLFKISLSLWSFEELQEMLLGDEMKQSVEEIEKQKIEFEKVKEAWSLEKQRLERDFQQREESLRVERELLDKQRSILSEHYENTNNNHIVGPGVPGNPFRIDVTSIEQGPPPSPTSNEQPHSPPSVSRNSSSAGLKNTDSIHLSNRWSHVPDHLLSATNEQKLPGPIQQQIPHKLTKLGTAPPVNRSSSKSPTPPQNKQNVNNINNKSTVLAQSFPQSGPVKLIQLAHSTMSTSGVNKNIPIVQSTPLKLPYKTSPNNSGSARLKPIAGGRHHRHSDLTQDNRELSSLLARTDCRKSDSRLLESHVPLLPATDEQDEQSHQTKQGEVIYF